MEARAQLRAQLTTQHVTETKVYEPHISKMISQLPRDGSTTDLMDWWYRFALDACTDYLFGKGVDSLLNPKVVHRLDI